MYLELKSLRATVSFWTQTLWLLLQQRETNHRMSTHHGVHLWKRQHGLRMNPVRCFLDPESPHCKVLVKPQALLAIWVTHVDGKGTRSRTGAERAAGMIQATESLFYKRKLKDSGFLSQA